MKQWVINWPSNPIYLTWSLPPISLVCCLFLFFQTPVDFVQFEFLLLRMQRSLPRRPGDVKRAPQRSCTHKAPHPPRSASERQQREREREGRERELPGKTRRHNNYTYTASRHIMRQCCRNFKEEHRYIKNNREQGRGRRKPGVGGEGKKRNYVNFYFLCYSTSMDACRDTNKNKKNIHKYRHIGSELACLKSSVAIKDK